MSMQTPNWSRNLRKRAARLERDGFTIAKPRKRIERYRLKKPRVPAANEGMDLASRNYRSFVKLLIGLKRRADKTDNVVARVLYVGTKERLYRARKKKLLQELV